MDTLIQPKAEGEIAFVLKHDLMGPGVTAADVLAATEGVMTCFEIVDSRIRDWKIKIQDTVVGQRLLRRVRARRPPGRSRGKSIWPLAAWSWRRTARSVAPAPARRRWAHPVNAVAWLTNTLGRLGIPLKAGEVMLSGSLGPMIPVKAGDNLRVTIGGIGGCSVRFF